MTILVKKSASRVGAPRWMVTFADLMALLFALFVLLLSFSEIDSDKFKKNAGPMRSAFRGVTILPPSERPLPPVERKIPSPADEFDRVTEWKDDLIYHLRTSMAREIARQEITVIEKEREIVIRFPDTTTFPSGGSELMESVLPTLDKVAQVLASTTGLIVVSGHTDDVPIATATFRSNWDLSTSRAVSVVHHLLAGGRIEPRHITAQGFADSRPLVANTSPGNRAVNRRVEIAIEIPFVGDEAAPSLF